ncbi:interleukin-1 receptor type 2 isoform X2 [Hemicordylus capensis]|nr:interleukin-1 receptor type 2 isoform X2 [Hemicordylus capensis]XP_053162596.1 interleukin-1 receptor type 2 isoform X2 [Hemicordylus capensis]XP_053162597.1 interleukin-1 receptor type 2 isoform X2 [Hemicordylus capensis]XP_053162598.1 interleukin-1 receptor type 2 isoform X2 [Hemicordylus capensis]XP_053162600.1 interleukin-1 receptor type 2 isoform X2 [Hemicordylus capensis]XP_053162601.1 interleukin-1 receptor type 2 isoform X2 [Hemicordylus capensis]XP_053162602.1 interleukin-1 recept
MLCLLSTNTLDASAFRIQRVEIADNCQDHTAHSRSTFALAGEPLILNHSLFKYEHMDTLDLDLNFTWYKNNLTAMIPVGIGETRILLQDGDLWFLPASLEDAGEYICIQRNSSYCVYVSIHLAVVEDSAAHEIAYPQKAFISLAEKVVCPSLEGFVQMNTNYELKWYKGSTLVAIDNKKFTARKGTDYLIVNSVSSDDSGYYTCQTSFEHEGAQYNITRTVHLQIFGLEKKSRPVIVYPKQRITLAALGSRLTIPCKVLVGESSHFNTEVWWLVNNTYIDEIYPTGRITEGKREELVENYDNYIEVPLIFDPVEEADFDTNFICAASNTRGHHVQAVQIKQEEPRLSWYLAAIPVALATLIVGGIYMHKCWKRRSAGGYITTKS